MLIKSPSGIGYNYGVLAIAVVTLALSAQAFGAVDDISGPDAPLWVSGEVIVKFKSTALKLDY